MLSVDAMHNLEGVSAENGIPGAVATAPGHELEKNADIVL